MTPNRRMAALAGGIFFLDQATKQLVLQYLGGNEEIILVSGFFKLVHWGNTGAAWSLFYGNNEMLAIISLGALLALFLSRRHFDTGSFWGQFSLGLIFGGIVGNLLDRLRLGHVVDFIYFFLYQRGGGEKGFPAFNVADTAICTGVGLLLLLSWKNENASRGVSAEPGR